MFKTNINAYYVKLDVTGLACNICNEPSNTLEQMISHLKQIHKRRLYTDVNNRILPFKFEGESLSCFMCSNAFSSFKRLQEHMNIHYRNFVCEVCDAGFLTRTMAVAHTSIHKTGTYNCSHCSKSFDTELKKVSHEKSVHTRTAPQNRCGFCTEKFKYYHSKLKHLAEVHGIDSHVKCQACEKSFESQKKLRVHVRKDHLMERHYKCTQCDMKFFKGNELHDHMVKHTGLKLFQCAVCLKSYGRKKSLAFHMRVHNEELR